MNDEQHFLANAYLDGELTVEERAIAEADPDVMSEVDKLRDLQSKIRDVRAPTAAVRESAIAAAMAEFSPVAAAPRPAAAPTARTVAFRPRPAYSRYLAIAAAVVAVGLLGVVVVKGVGGRGDDDSSGDAVSSEVAADEAGDDSGDAAVAERDMTELDTAEAPSAAVGDAPAADSDDMADAGDAADSGVAGDGEDTAAETFESSDDAAASADDVGDSGFIAVTPLDEPVGEPFDPSLPTPAELGSYGAALLVQRDEQELPATPETRCVFPDAEDPAEILGRGEFPTEVGIVELLVAVDEVNEVVYGIDPGTCQTLVEGPLL